MKLDDKKLGEILLSAKLLPAPKLKAYTEKAKNEKIALATYLTAEEIIGRKHLGKAIAAYFKVNHIDLETVNIDPKILQTIPKIVAQQAMAVIFDKDKQGIHLAMNNPADQEFVNNFSKRNGNNVIIYFADELSIQNALKQYPAETDINLQELVQTLGQQKDGLTKPEDLPIIKIVDKLLNMGYTNQASDIHIEPYEDETTVRLRIDGILHDILKVPHALHDLLVTRIKILSRLRTDEHRAAQDGRLKFKHGKAKIDVRVSIVPVIHGEKVVLRLLAEKARQYDLENLGFSKADFKKIKKSIKSPWGMLLVTGPTGCGKTTTLYSILKKLSTREINISTIEDPVEYDIEGINQIQVNPKTNLTFSKGLRAIVRQDPDIIMVGEIRDKETASIGINSAMTGHLVLSTLHTNDAATTLPRLLDMGVKPFLVASTINIAIAQRLVRKICEKCRYKTTITPKTIELIEKQLPAEIVKKFQLNDPKTILYYGKGCKECNSTGYQGRMGIFEIIKMNEEIKKLVMEKANAATIKNKAIELGMTTLLEDGIDKVLTGKTTIDEIIRVTRE